jgi:hypothetical protein
LGVKKKEERTVQINIEKYKIPIWELNLTPKWDLKFSIYIIFFVIYFFSQIPKGAFIHSFIHCESIKHKFEIANFAA